MRTSSIVLLFVIITCFANSQPNRQLIGNWNGGDAFEKQYSDSLLIFHFEKDAFRFNYGPNHFNEYKAYNIKGDTLVLLNKNRRFQQAAFRIEELTENRLVIQALNWPAVYICNVLCSPWNEADAPKIPKKQDFDTETILSNDVLKTRLEFEKLINTNQ